MSSLLALLFMVEYILVSTAESQEPMVKWFSFHWVMNSFTLSFYIFQYVKIHSSTYPQLAWFCLIEEHPMQKVI